MTHESKNLGVGVGENVGGERVNSGDTLQRRGDPIRVWRFEKKGEGIERIFPRNKQKGRRLLGRLRG